MPITGRKPADCFNAFRDHLGPVIEATIGHPVLVCKTGDETRRALCLGPPNSADVGVELNGAHGKFYLSLQQNLEAVFVEQRKHYALKTRKYRYAITESVNEMAEPIMRWDYSSVPPKGKQCRHHFQLGRVEQTAVSVPFNSHWLDLNRLHTPTGFVLIEYVLRFVLTDLGVRPARDGWEDVLSKSEAAFFAKLSSKTS